MKNPNTYQLQPEKDIANYSVSKLMVFHCLGSGWKLGDELEAIIKAKAEGWTHHLTNEWTGTTGLREHFFTKDKTPCSPISPDSSGRYWNPYTKSYELSADENVAVINWMTGLSTLGRML